MFYASLCMYITEETFLQDIHKEIDAFRIYRKMFLGRY